MAFTNSPIEKILTDKATELLTAAAIEERKAAGNTTLVYQYRFAAQVIEDLKARIEELDGVPFPVRIEVGRQGSVSIPVYPGPAPDLTDCPPGCLHSEPGPTPEESGVDPAYEAFIADIGVGSPPAPDAHGFVSEEPDTTRIVGMPDSGYPAEFDTALTPPTEEEK